MDQAAAIRLLALDVDGVLTDGSIYIDDHGVESKRFHIRDGFAIVQARRLGLKVGVLTGRSSRCVMLRLTELGVEHVMQGVADKAEGLERLCAAAGVEPERAAYVGDDLIDIPALMLAGLPVAVADAVPEVRQIARLITRAPGGQGAVREVIEVLLRAQGRWEELLDRYRF